MRTPSSTSRGLIIAATSPGGCMPVANIRNTRPAPEFLSPLRETGTANIRKGDTP
ncbi:MAG: hypothetical protein JNM76_05840 [Betaproteobacteria bacterium]|nr:hypothetical protein [Betaproteobacteria bacterium]